MKIALVVGVGQYNDDDISPLRYASKDAKAVSEILESECDFDRVELLTDEHGEHVCEAGRIWQRWFELIREFKRDDLPENSSFLFYFAGHGVEFNNAGHLLTRDSLSADYSVMSIKVQDLSENLEKVSATNRLIVIDACRNTPEAGARDVGVSSVMPYVFSRDVVNMARAQSEHTKERRTGLLLSCHAQERSWEISVLGHGVMTYYLLKRLRDRDRDKTLTFRELAAQVKSDVEHWAETNEKRQRPYYQIDGVPFNELADDTSPIVIAKPHTKKEEAIEQAEERAETAEIVESEPTVQRENTSAETVSNAPQTAQTNRLPDLLISPFGPERALQGRRAWADLILRSNAENDDVGCYVNPVGVAFSLIPPGEFFRGSPQSDARAPLDERPRRRVRITKPYFLSIHPISQKEYRKVMGHNPSYFKPNRDDRDRNRIAAADASPVENVTYRDAISFLNKLNEAGNFPPVSFLGPRSSKWGWRYFLPTEAEWEYAARAGSTTKYWTGDTLSHDLANFGGRHNRPSQRLPTTKSNPFGIVDVHGNISEFCVDWYDSDYYQDSPQIDPQGPRGPLDFRVIRGGSWSDSARQCGSASREYKSEGSSYQTIGFRAAIVLKKI